MQWTFCHWIKSNLGRHKQWGIDVKGLWWFAHNREHSSTHCTRIWMLGVKVFLVKLMSQFLDCTNSHVIQTASCDSSIFAWSGGPDPKEVVDKTIFVGLFVLLPRLKVFCTQTYNNGWNKKTTSKSVWLGSKRQNRPRCLKWKEAVNHPFSSMLEMESLSAIRNGVPSHYSSLKGSFWYNGAVSIQQVWKECQTVLNHSGLHASWGNMDVLWQTELTFHCDSFGVINPLSTTASNQ